MQAGSCTQSWGGGEGEEMGTRTEPRTEGAGSASPACRFLPLQLPLPPGLKLNASGSRQIDLVLLSPEHMPCQDWVVLSMGRLSFRRGNEVLNEDRSGSPTQVWVTWRSDQSGWDQAAGTKVSLMVPPVPLMAWNLIQSPA